MHKVAHEVMHKFSLFLYFLVNQNILLQGPSFVYLSHWWIYFCPSQVVDSMRDSAEYYFIPNKSLTFSMSVAMGSWRMRADLSRGSAHCGTPEVEVGWGEVEGGEGPKAWFTNCQRDLSWPPFARASGSKHHLHPGNGRSRSAGCCLLPILGPISENGGSGWVAGQGLDSRQMNCDSSRRCWHIPEMDPARSVKGRKWWHCGAWRPPPQSFQLARAAW